VAKRVSSQIPIAIKSSTIIENMSPWFDGIHTTQVFKFFPREKSKPIFSNRNMICDCSHVHIMSLSVQTTVAKVLLWHRMVQWSKNCHQVSWGIDFSFHLKLETLFSKYLKCHCIPFSCCSPIMFCMGRQVWNWMLLFLSQQPCEGANWGN